MEAPQRILVVDDNPTNVLILARSLEKNGYTVLSANDGATALRLARTGRPDLVLLDMMMPDQDGTEVCRILKSQPETARIPVLFVTARAELDDVMDAFNAGASDYITKPFRFAEVAARVNVHLKLRRTEQELRQQHQASKELTARLGEANLQLVRASRTDPLTQLLNRGAWEESIELEHARAQRHGAVYSLLMIDVDHFKLFNDTLGHQAGDECLRRIARCVTRAARSVDVVGRYGGEEFVVLAPETDAAAAMTLAERIRRRIWGLNLTHPSSAVSNRVTVSVGVACGTGEEREDVLRSADEALYAAKHAGRNRARLGRRADEAGRRPGEATVAGTESAYASTGATVLIVDNNLADRAMCRGILGEQGYRVLVAGDGATAVRLATKHPPDVAMIAASLPQGEGFAAVRRLKTRLGSHGVPVLMITSPDATTEIAAGIQAGADEFLSRPINKAELTLRVWSALRYQFEQRERMHSTRDRDEQTRILRGLLDFCQEIGESTTLEQVYRQTVAAAAEVSGCPRIAILLTTPQDTLRIVAAEDDGDLETPGTFPVEGSISGRAVCLRRSLVINDTREAEVWSNACDRVLLERLPAAAAPLSASGKVVGVLCMAGGREGRSFTPQELEYINLIASIAGSTINGLLSCSTATLARDAIVIALGKLAEHRDSHSGRHVDRVTRLSVILAEELRRSPTYQDQIDDAFLADIERAAALHDIGKVAIPDAILLKTDRLTREERDVICTHANIGAEIIHSVAEATGESGFSRHGGGHRPQPPRMVRRQRISPALAGSSDSACGAYHGAGGCVRCADHPQSLQGGVPPRTSGPDHPPARRQPV